MPSLYELHKIKWSQGCGAYICPPRARYVCHARGTIPADVAMIGEAPGDSEDMLGSPFTGPAGHLLDQIVAHASRKLMNHQAGRPPTFLFANLVGCIPFEEPGPKRKAEEPSVESIMQCQPRLQELIDICQPALVVSVGALSRQWCKQGFKQNIKFPASVKHWTDIIHPAALLRVPVATKGFAVQQCAVRLREALIQVFGE